MNQDCRIWNDEWRLKTGGGLGGVFAKNDYRLTIGDWTGEEEAAGGEVLDSGRSGVDLVRDAFDQAGNDVNTALDDCNAALNDINKAGTGFQGRRGA